MPRTTPPRPLDVEALFPELAAYRGTTTRLHPRPGRPEPTASSVGGPLLWPADEPWPVCGEAHGGACGRRPADIHRRRQVLAAAWARAHAPGPTDEERELLVELQRKHRLPGGAETDPLPMIGLAQLYRRDVPDLPAGPDDCDLLQVFWCPFTAHGPSGHGLELHLRWRRSWEVGRVLTAPPVIGADGFLPEPCVLHPEQVVTYPYADLLPEELCARIDAWEDALKAEAERNDPARRPYRDGDGLWDIAHWAAERDSPPVWRQPPAARQYRRDLRRFPTVRGPLRFRLRNRVKWIG